MVEAKSGVSDPADLHAEISRLRTKVEQLQSEVSGKHSRSHSSAAEDDSPSDSAQDIPERALDEGGKLLRGFALASIETLRLAGNLVSELGEEVLDRNHPESPRSRSGKRSDARSTPRSLVSDLPGDFYAGLNSVVDRSLDVPAKVVDKFYQAYKETASVQRTSAERELSRAARALSRAERISKVRREEKADRKTAPEGESPKAV
jgi:hypothetical protein